MEQEQASVPMDARLLSAVSSRAVASGVAVTDVVEEAVRRYLATDELWVEVPDEDAVLDLTYRQLGALRR